MVKMFLAAGTALLELKKASVLSKRRNSFSARFEELCNWNNGNV